MYKKNPRPPGSLVSCYSFFNIMTLFSMIYFLFSTFSTRQKKKHAKIKGERKGKMEKNIISKLPNSRYVTNMTFLALFSVSVLSSQSYQYTIISMISRYFIVYAIWNVQNVVLKLMQLWTNKIEVTSNLCMSNMMYVPMNCTKE